MATFYWVRALSGGILIGLSATILLLFNGRIAGVSGMVNGAIKLTPHERWRWTFILGLFIGGALYEYVLAPQPTPTSIFSPRMMIIGGFLVGFGTRMGNGCTSGHGVCGLGRLSVRSLAAVLTFILTAISTVLVTHQALPK